MNKEVEKIIDNIRDKCIEIVNKSDKRSIDRDYAITASLEIIADLCHLCIEQSKQINNLETLFKDYVDIKGIRNDKIDKLINGQ